MNKLRYKLAIFMQGRYGPDDLYKASLILYLILLIANVFLNSTLISIIISLLVVWVFFRFFSKNISARYRENVKYLNIKNRLKNGFGIFKKRFTDRTHVYRKCPECRATLRFPRKKGFHDAVCPKCKKSIKVKIRF